MYVILEADGNVYRIYDTIPECWKCDLIRPRREHLTYNEFRSALARGETVDCSSFYVRKCRGVEDVENYARTKTEWDASVGATLKLNKLLMMKNTELIFQAKLISTGETRRFSFADLYGYEGETQGVFIDFDDDIWQLSCKSGCTMKGSMNPDLEITLVCDD